MYAGDGVHAHSRLLPADIDRSVHQHSGQLCRSEKTPDAHRPQPLHRQPHPLGHDLVRRLYALHAPQDPASPVVHGRSPM